LPFVTAPPSRDRTRASHRRGIGEPRGSVVAGWGWQDNGYGVNVLGEVVVFETRVP